MVEQIINLVTKVLPKGVFGVEVVTRTLPNYPKTRNGKINPYHGRVIKATQYKNVAIGYGYSQYVNAKLTRMFGKPTRTHGEGNGNGGYYTDGINEYPIFKSQPMKGRKWIEGLYSLISYSIQDHDKKYLRLTMRPNTTEKVLYFMDGILVTEQNVIHDIQSWEKSSKGNNIYGLGEYIKVKDITLTNVCKIECGKHRIAKAFKTTMD